MKARFYVDVEVDENQFTNEPLIENCDDPESIRADAHFESFRYLSWVLDEYLDGKKPVGYKGPEVFIKELHAKYCYPDPAGTILFGVFSDELEDEDGTERPERSMEQHSNSNPDSTEST